jgi:AcrR family transcriptional regulator
VARPKEPLISKRLVFAAALQIIDEEGLDGLSTRRLASVLHVSGPALYHHFASKDDIIAGAVELALENVRVPARSGADWREWLFRNAQLFRQGLLAHPNLLPALVDRRLPRIGLSRIDEAIRRLNELGLPSHATLAIVDALEAFAIGTAILEASAGLASIPTADLTERFPALAEALGHPSLKAKEQFDVGCRAIIDALATTFWVPAGRF